MKEPEGSAVITPVSITPSTRTTSIVTTASGSKLLPDIEAVSPIMYSNWSVVITSDPVTARAGDTVTTDIEIRLVRHMAKINSGRDVIFFSLFRYLPY